MSVVVFTLAFLTNGGIAEDHGALEAGQLPRVWTRNCRETESPQKASGAKYPSLDSAEGGKRFSRKMSAGAV